MNPNIVSILAESAPTSWPDVVGFLGILAFCAFMAWSANR